MTRYLDKLKVGMKIEYYDGQHYGSDTLTIKEIGEDYIMSTEGLIYTSMMFWSIKILEGLE